MLEDLCDYLSESVNGIDVLGLGTGRTVKAIISCLHERGSLKGKRLIVSSVDTELALTELGYSVTNLSSRPQLYIDGFDMFLEDRFALIKGGGGAMTREKVLAHNSARRIYVGDSSKARSPKSFSLPAEVLWFALSAVLDELEGKGFEPSVRVGQGKMGPVVSDNGNPIIDITVQRERLEELVRLLDSIPGVVEHGYFERELLNEVILYDEKSFTVRRRD